MIFSSVYPYHVLSSKAADKLHYEYVSKGDSFPVGNYYLPVYQLKKVSKCYLFTADFSNADDYKDFDGIIGSALLDSNVVDVDFPCRFLSYL